jgi:hypothetical protein
MKITIMAGLFAKRNMDIDTGHSEVINFEFQILSYDVKFRIYVSGKDLKLQDLLKVYGKS